GVDLDYVQTGASAPDALARSADSAWLPIAAAILAIESHGQYACERGLAGSSRSAQEITVRDSSARDCAAKRVGYMGLYRNAGEVFWAVFTGEGERHLGGKIPQA